MIDPKTETEGRERFQLDPQGERKMVSENAEPLLRKESRFSDGECFLVEMLRQSHRSLGTIRYDLKYDLAL